MVFEYSFRLIGRNLAVVAVNPNVFNERKKLYAKLVVNLCKKLHNAIPFEHDVIEVHVRKMRKYRRQGYCCVKKLVRFDIPRELAEQLLLEREFSPKLAC